MARKGSVRVSITGDSDGLGRATKDAEHKLDRLNKAGGASLRKLGSAAKLGGAAMAVGLAGGLTASAKAAIEAEKAQARLEAQLKSMGKNTDEVKKKIDGVIQSQSQMSGFDDEDLQDSFVNLARVTGDVNESLKLNATAMDIARAKNMDVAKAGELVAKVAGGNVGILSRYGIVLKDGASASEALAALQSKFGGQAEAYGKTTAGSLDRMKVAGENLAETAGKSLAPAISTVAGGISNFITEMQTGQGAGGRFRTVITDAFKAVKSGVGTAIKAIGGFLRDNREDIKKVGQAFQNIGKVIKFAFEEVALPIIKRVIPAISGYVKGMVKVIGGVVKTISSILTGDFGGAWDGVKKIFSGAIKTVGGIIRGATAPFREGAKRAVDGIKAVFEATLGKVIEKVGGWVGDLVGTLQNAIGKAKELLGLANKAADTDWDRIFPKANPNIPYDKRATGGRVTRPMFLVGEEAPQHDEFVIATNPRYRRENMGYLVQAAAALGIPGFKKGGRPPKPKKSPGPGQYWAWNKKGKTWVTRDKHAALKGHGGDSYVEPDAGSLSQLVAPSTLTKKQADRIAQLEYEYAAAELTGPSAADSTGLVDDYKAADAIATFWQQMYDAGVKNKRPASVLTELAQALKAARSTRDSINEAYFEAIKPPETTTPDTPEPEPTPDTEPTPEPATPAEPSGPTADEIARRDQADLRAFIASRAAYLNASAGNTFAGAGDLGYGMAGGGPVVVINQNNLTPGDSRVMKNVADSVVGAIGLVQGSVTSPRAQVA